MKAEVITRTSLFFWQKKKKVTLLTVAYTVNTQRPSDNPEFQWNLTNHHTHPSSMHHHTRQSHRHTTTTKKKSPTLTQGSDSWPGSQLHTWRRGLTGREQWKHHTSVLVCCTVLFVEPLQLLAHHHQTASKYTRPLHEPSQHPASAANEAERHANKETPQTSG